MAELSEAELLHLVDRAEAGTLLAEEAVLLRAGIRRYAAAERVLASAFNAAKQVAISTFMALQSLGLLDEPPTQSISITVHPDPKHVADAIRDLRRHR